MILDSVERLVDLVSRSNVSQVTLESGDRRLTIRLGSPGPTPIPHGGADETDLGSTAPTETPAEPLEPNRCWITSPLVGIFHHADPSVGPGQPVDAGQVVGVIESMKLMNDVRSEIVGVVTQAAIDEGMPVEYGQPLFAVGPLTEAESWDLQSERPSLS